MTNTNLIQLVKDDIHAFMKNNQELFFNERDFQMHLAMWLKDSANKYDDVDLEYYIPREILNNTPNDYEWSSELRLDIVVKKGTEYVPVELKYKTKIVNKKTLLRFDENINASAGDTFKIIKSQGAQDLGMYDFWKDVRRLEHIRNRFKNVIGGLAVFLTNDTAYQHIPKESSNNYYLNISEGIHSCDKHWNDSESTCAKGHPKFKVEHAYTIEWHPTKADCIDFNYCIVTIEGKSRIQ